jgi:hypothetical protein
MAEGVPTDPLGDSGYRLSIGVDMLFQLVLGSVSSLSCASRRTNSTSNSPPQLEHPKRLSYFIDLLSLTSRCLACLCSRFASFAMC